MTAPHKPTPTTREIVRALSCFGVKQTKTSAYIDVDEKTLRLHYRHELDHGLDLATAEVVSNLHKLATKPNGGMPTAVAIETWLVLMAGRSEKTAVAVNLDPEAGDWPEGQSPRERLLAKIEALNINLNGGKQETVQDPAFEP